MKFELTPAFEGDWARLSKVERATFQKVLRQEFHPACERRTLDPGAAWPASLRVKAVQGAAWPASLRVKAVQGAPGVWEMTWSFAGPDGRATFEWVEIQGEPGIRWRRVGGHAIFGAP